MMPPVTQCMARVKSVQEYLSAVDIAFSVLCNQSQGGRCELWYRGLAQQSFQLLPSISRTLDTTLQLNAEFETVFLSKFKSLIIPYVERLPAFPLPNGIPSYWNWLFQMQHYGVPTRLLDWSRDALVALFFATDPTNTSRKAGVDNAVYVLNPVTLNTAFSFHSFLKPGYIPNVEEPEFNLYFGPDSQLLSTKKPAAAIGPLNSTRIVAQRGTFTVFPLVKGLEPMEDFDDASTYLFKICVQADKSDMVFSQLQHYGITRIALFPEIQQIASEIALEVLNEGVNTIDP